MYQLTKTALEALGAEITTREIKQQPEIWLEAYQNYLSKKPEITAFLDKIRAKHDRVQVIFTGAGSSDFVGEAIFPYLNQVNDQKQIEFRAVGTVELVGRPMDYLQADIPTILVSFARSGNSPESLHAVKLAKQLVTDLYLIHITCAPDGQLALTSADDDQTLLLLQPERSNDAGFAMTGSYSCMMLTALLVFSPASDEEKGTWVTTMSKLAQDVLDREAEMQALVDLDFDRIIYLGAGGLRGLAHEVQLKILELTAGQIATQFESPLGFRHGPKSFINDKTLVFVFASNDAYTRQYDLDLINEVAGDQIARNLTVLTASPFEGTQASQFVLAPSGEGLPDAFVAFPYLVFAQTIALLTAIKCKNKPDTPSPTGTVNRVVQGVILHDYKS